jgi:hypothetical protein
VQAPSLYASPTRWKHEPLTFLAHHPEANIVKFSRGTWSGAKRASTRGKHERTRPAPHARPLGVGSGTNRVIVRVIIILHPFRHISAHVINAPHIRFLVATGWVLAAANRSGSLRFDGCPCERERHLRRYTKPSRAGTPHIDPWC